ncbi:MAG: type II toxin-antitoxin system RelE/ParE family toxin [Pseudomonadota bacterium]|nr:MAG: type II toxin-antitoxin system RelE/ParE family toxin [Pseudomonadota bacterium]
MSPHLLISSVSRRRAEQLSAGLRRYEYRSHIIFYQAIHSEIMIVRVLHYRMDVRRHL